MRASASRTVPAPEEKAGDGAASVVHGFVRTPEGEPVRGAAVTLLTPGGRQLDRVLSLADGAYVVAVPSPGTCLPAVSASSHGARAAHVTVGEGPHVHDVELTPGGVDVVN
ncbi:carboxypeptidase-like regulatory domain-containing protein [Streptomyces cellulosae]